MRTCAAFVSFTSAPAAPRRARPFQAMPLLACHSVARRAVPSPTKPCLPRRACQTLPRLALPCQAKPRYACQTLPFRAKTRRAYPILPRRA
jgi:hypothetical protein